MQIRYVVLPATPPEPWGRFAIELDAVSAPTLDLVLPSWVPGSYHIDDWVRFVRDLRASRGPDGAALPVRRLEKSRWRVETRGADRVRVEYSVYGHANPLLNESYDLNSEHLFLNPAVCFPYVDGHLTDPVEVELQVPSDWRVVTELAEAGGAPHRYRAPGYDVLADSPIDAGRPLVLTLHPRGIPHRIVLCGEGGNYESHRLEEDLGRIVEAAIRLVGDTPLSSYTFFYHLTDVPDGGLEHATSHSCILNRNGFRPEKAYREFLDLASHEYFHLYNVKRIRPKVLGPFDYTREVYTRLLWWMEGGTDYFGSLAVRRAGLYTPRQYLDHYADALRRYRETPGRRRISLEESSYLTWVGLYQRDLFEDWPNQGITYYLKGDLVCLALDLEIRHATENRASLETVLRTLWTDYGRPGRGLEEDELLAVAERATGVPLGPFFERYVAGTADLDLDAFARYAGLTVGPKPKKKDDEAEEHGYLGVHFEDAGGLARLTTVLAETPARRAGLLPGDAIVALDGARVPFGEMARALRRYAPGDPVEFTYFRRGFLHRATVHLGQPLPEGYVWRTVPGADELAKRIYEGWIGVAWEPPGDDADGGGDGSEPWMR
jgi:predicted metalloprotease with PDZ domain